MGRRKFGQNYYQEHEIVYNLESDFHRPFVLQEQDSLETQSSLSKIFLIENGEIPILYNPLAFGEKSLQQSWKVFVCRYLPTNKLAFLCVLCDSAVKANNFTLFLIRVRHLASRPADCPRSTCFELLKRRSRHQDQPWESIGIPAQEHFLKLSVP